MNYLPKWKVEKLLEREIETYIGTVVPGRTWKAVGLGTKICDIAKGSSRTGKLITTGRVLGAIMTSRAVDRTDHSTANLGRVAVPITPR